MKFFNSVGMKESAAKMLMLRRFYKKTKEGDRKFDRIVTRYYYNVKLRSLQFSGDFDDRTINFDRAMFPVQLQIFFQAIFTHQQEERSMTLYFYDNTQRSLNRNFYLRSIGSPIFQNFYFSKGPRKLCMKRSELTCKLSSESWAIFIQAFIMPISICLLITSVPKLLVIQLTLTRLVRETVHNHPKNIGVSKNVKSRILLAACTLMHSCIYNLRIAYFSIDIRKSNFHVTLTLCFKFFFSNSRWELLGNFQNSVVNCYIILISK